MKLEEIRGVGQKLLLEAPISCIWNYWICSLQRDAISEKARCKLQILLANKVLDWFSLRNTEKTNSMDYRVIDIFLLAFFLENHKNLVFGIFWLKLAFWSKFYQNIKKCQKHVFPVFQDYFFKNQLLSNFLLIETWYIDKIPIQNINLLKLWASSPRRRYWND